MRVRNDEAQLDVRIDGENGDAVVLLAGFPLTREIWDAQAQTLAATHRVIRPDLRGMGASSAPPGPYLMETLAGDIAAVLDAIGVERAALVGHSLGGYVAIAFARMYCERLTHLALVCSRIGADTPETMELRYDLADRAEAEASIAPIAQWYEPRLRASGDEHDAVKSALIHATVNAIDPRGAAAMLRGMAVRDAGDDIAGDLDLPVLVVAGGRDQLLPEAAARQTAAAFSRGEFLVCERSGHLPMLDEPVEIEQALARLLAR
ncbi:MAG TPA: alpha/beta hydrolase [Candidatus Baltobacteraceae bacterium]|jgi:pimeloyl-ACP methyl ester carboxylesterase|nr:alpha/beta hydrolase [Candidatus Baltobacteraceae bacterium]